MADVPVYSMSAFRRDASGKIKPQDSGGGGGPSQQTVTQTNIPEYARPYVEDTLGRAQALTTQRTYEPYAGQRLAGFTPMQAQAFQNIAGQQYAPQLTEASNIASNVAQAGLGVQPIARELQSTALDYGAAGSGYGSTASVLGIQGADAARRASQQAQQQALAYGAQGAQYGAQGAQQAGQVAGTAGQQAQLFGGIGAGYGAAATGMAPQAQQYGAAGMGYGAQGAGIGSLGVQAAGQGFGAGQAYAQQATSPVGFL